MEITDYNWEYDLDDNYDDLDNSFENDHPMDFDPCNHHDSVSFGRAGNEKTLEYDLRQAQKNVDYYQREIRNFSEFTTDTYKKNCISHLEKALERTEEISEELRKIRSK